jgi:hypothetical protein
MRPQAHEVMLAWGFAYKSAFIWRKLTINGKPRMGTGYRVLEAEDAMAAWIDEAGERRADIFESSTALYRSWKSWADRAGEHAGSLKKFSQRLEDRCDALGVRKGRDGQGLKGFFGLRVTNRIWPAAARRGSAMNAARHSAIAEESHEHHPTACV